MKSVLVTGSYGQLAACIKDKIHEHPEIAFVFTDLPELDITKENQVFDFFSNNEFSWCINCAAYTDVDKAETEKQISYEVNELGAANLAKACKKYKVKLIHISTDFVFSGESSKPYDEFDIAEPVSIYGDSKLKGEQSITSIMDNYFIIRTSWLYSEHGNNFYKTMLNLSKVKKEINVIFDQIGAPTYAGDLTKVILKIITIESNKFGIYHYSNEGVASWYDFAMAIFDESKYDVKINPLRTNQYPTPATRPQYSVLDKSKIRKAFEIEIPYWRYSLKQVIEKQ